MAVSNSNHIVERTWRPIRNVMAFGDVWLSRHLNRAPRTLPILVIMITDKCNLKCTMCGACDYSPGDHNMLSLDDWKAVIDSAAQLKTQILSITGGEAMLRKDLFDLIRYTRGKGIRVHLNTNATILREKQAELLRDTGVETVSISIESHEEDIHDLIRGRGMFQRTLEGVRRLRRIAPDVRIGLNCVINKHNVNGLHGMVPFAAREGLDQVKFAPIHSNLQHKDKDVSEYEDMIFQETDLDALEGELQKIQDELKKTELVSTSKQFFDGITNLYKPPASNFYCYAGWAITVIDAQGNVAACFDKDGAMNVRKTPLHEIWKSKTFQEHRQQVVNCDKACWDTTNAELSLRLSVKHLVEEPLSLVRSVRYYIAQRRPKSQAPAPRIGEERG